MICFGTALLALRAGMDVEEKKVSFVRYMEARSPFKKTISGFGGTSVRWYISDERDYTVTQDVQAEFWKEFGE